MLLNVTGTGVLPLVSGYSEAGVTGLAEIKGAAGFLYEQFAVELTQDFIETFDCL